jgi:hypothetical protein
MQNPIAPLDRRSAPRNVPADAVYNREQIIAEFGDERLPEIKFDGKLRKHLRADDGEPISEDDDFVALCDEAGAWWIKFNGPGIPPDKVGGNLYADGFTLPLRTSLGDNDPTAWEPGLSGDPVDPWKMQLSVPILHVPSGELFVWSTMSATGRRALGTLLKHYDRMSRSSTDLPVVRLKTGGFKHKDPRVGFVKTPTFVVTGKSPRDSAPKSNMNGADFERRHSFLGRPTRGRC